MGGTICLGLRADWTTAAQNFCAMYMVVSPFWAFHSLISPLIWAYTYHVSYILCWVFHSLISPLVWSYTYHVSYIYTRHVVSIRRVSIVVSHSVSTNMIMPIINIVEECGMSWWRVDHVYERRVSKGTYMHPDEIFGTYSFMLRVATKKKRID